MTRLKIRLHSVWKSIKSALSVQSCIMIWGEPECSRVYDYLILKAARMQLSSGGGEKGKDVPVAWDRREESPKSTEVAPGFSLRSASHSGFEKGSVRKSWQKHKFLMVVVFNWEMMEGTSWRVWSNTSYLYTPEEGTDSCYIKGSLCILLNK